MNDKEFEAMSLFEQMAWIGRESEKILKPLADESRADTYRMAHPTRSLKDKDNERLSGN